jgi:hypothetical protein
MWIFLILLLWSTPAVAQVVAEVVAEDFKEDPKPRPAGETILPAFPIDKWEQPVISLDVALSAMEADPGLIITTVFEISKDGKTFAPIASVTSKGGPVNRGNKIPGPPGFKLSRKGVVPDGWVARMRVVTNKPLTFGAKAEPGKE